MGAGKQTKTVKKSTANKTAPKKAPAKKPGAGKSVKKPVRAHEKRGVGRPPVNDPSDQPTIEGKIATYFSNVEALKSRPTFCGLALALGYSSRTTLWEHSKRTEAISEPIRVALLRIEESYELGLRSTSPTGAIFALKNRGWVDKPEDDGKDDTIARLLAIAERLTSGA